MKTKRKGVGPNLRRAPWLPAPTPGSGVAPASAPHEQNSLAELLARGLAHDGAERTPAHSGAGIAAAAAEPGDEGHAASPSEAPPRRRISDIILNVVSLEEQIYLGIRDLKGIFK